MRSGKLAVCAPTVSGFVDVAPNLQAGFREVDLGGNVGVQFAQSADEVLVPVTVDAGAYKLTSFQIVVAFDDAVLRAEGYEEGVANDALASAVFTSPTVTLNDPTDEALLVGTRTATSRLRAWCSSRLAG